MEPESNISNVEDEVTSASGSTAAEISSAIDKSGSKKRKMKEPAEKDKDREKIRKRIEEQMAQSAADRARDIEAEEKAEEELQAQRKEKKKIAKAADKAKGEKKGYRGPARKQASEDDVFDYVHGGDYNIWYNRVQDFSTFKEKREAKLAGKRYRLDVDKDTGYTRASETDYICLYFARGKCINGSSCNYLHRVPNPEDDKRIDQMHDIFGREKHRMDRDDMGGVGSFMINNTTIYVAGVRTSPGVEEVVYKAFVKFGPILYLRVLHGRGLAFIKYKHRVSAEFAKEAMADQPLFKDEALNVRWATEFTDPTLKRQEEDRKQMEAWKRMKEKFPTFFSQYESLVNEEYPDTDDQYVVEDTSSFFVNERWLEGDRLDDDDSSVEEEKKREGVESMREALKKGEDNEIMQSGGRWKEDAQGGYFSWDSSTLHVRKKPARAKPVEQSAENATTAATNTNANDSGAGVNAEAYAAQAKAAEEYYNSKQYQAWQRYYASLNYPGYYDEWNRYHYYDPSTVAHAQTGQQDSAAQLPTPNMEGEQQQQQPAEEQAQSEQDYSSYYQQYNQGYQQQQDYQQPTQNAGQRQYSYDPADYPELYGDKATETLSEYQQEKQSDKEYQNYQYYTAKDQ